VSQRDAPLLAESYAGWNPRLGATGRIREPLARQIQLEAERPREILAHEDRRHRDLAIGHLAPRAAVLSLHADRVFALFRKTRVVERENASAHRDRRPQARPHGRRLPRRVRDEMLQRLVADRIAQPPMHGLHRLPLAVVEEGFEILTGRLALRASGEAARELVGKLAEPSQERASRWLGHARQRTQLSSSVQVRTRTIVRHELLDLTK
jgi:hypothetical protein